VKKIYRIRQPVEKNKKKNIDLSYTHIVPELLHITLNIYIALITERTQAHHKT